MSNLSEINYQKIQDLEYRLEQLKAQLVETDNTHSEEISNLTDTKANLDASNLAGSNLSNWQLSVARGYTQNKFYLDIVTTCGGDYIVTDEGITYCSLTITAPRDGYYLITGIVPALKVSSYTVKSAIFVDNGWWEIARSSFNDRHNGGVTSTRRIWLTAGPHIIAVRGFVNTGLSVNVNIPVYSDITMLAVMEQ